MGQRRSTRKPRPTNKDMETSDALKMVLKLSAQEAAASASSQPGSPSVSEVSASNNSEGDERPSKAGNKRSKRSQASTSAAKVAKKDDQVSDDDVSAAAAAPERNLRDRYKPASPRPQSTALVDTLNYLQKLIERKDNQHFFAFPINDMIAPSYSKVVKQPMDLSTTRHKIETKEYQNLMEYKGDIKLMCVNAMNYNHPETVYYKAAQRLLEYAMKTMSQDRLLSLRKNNPLMSGLLDSELALHLDVDASDYIAPSHTHKKKKDSNAYLTFEPVPDHLPAKDIIAIAKEKAAEAADHLARTQPNSKMGFLRMAEDGTTTLNILNPDHNGVISEKERVITLGEKVGKLKQGRSMLASLQVDDEYTDAKTVQYLDYGSYSSAAPLYDSTFASLSKKESDMLLSYYGTQNSLDYIQSLRTFVADSNDSLINMIENLLDSRTGGKHSQAVKALKEQRAAESEKLQASLPSEALPNRPGEFKPSESADKGTDSVDFKSLESLKDIGIDISFLDHFKQTDEDGIQGQLDKAASQVTQLHDMQSSRLSQLPGSDGVKVTSDQEAVAADSLSDTLASITKQATPGQVTDVHGIHEAIGVGRVHTSSHSNADKVDTLMTEQTSSSNRADDPVYHHVPLDRSPTHK